MDKEYLKELVGSGELEQVFATMLGYGKRQKAVVFYNALLIQHNQFKKLEQDKIKGVLSAEEVSLRENRILSALLTLIDDLPEKDDESTPNDPTVHKASQPRWPLWVLIGAVLLLGIIISYSKLNLFAEKEGTASTPPAEVIIPERKNETIQTLQFPEGDEVIFIFSTGSEISYRLLNGDLKNLGGDARRVSFTIRCSAKKGNGANFWDDTFRLELDESGALLPPASGLNEVVASNSFQDGTVFFVVKGAFSKMKLAIINPWDAEDIRKLAISTE